VPTFTRKGRKKRNCDATAKASLGIPRTKNLGEPEKKNRLSTDPEWCLMLMEKRKGMLPINFTHPLNLGDHERGRRLKTQGAKDKREGGGGFGQKQATIEEERV